MTSFTRHHLTAWRTLQRANALGAQADFLTTSAGHSLPIAVIVGDILTAGHCYAGSVEFVGSKPYSERLPRRPIEAQDNGGLVTPGISALVSMPC